MKKIYSILNGINMMSSTKETIKPYEYEEPRYIDGFVKRSWGVAPKKWVKCSDCGAVECQDFRPRHFKLKVPCKGVWKDWK